ncbi:hypothetical protein ACO2FQ_13515 [Lacticaseibacillus paracasei]|uniref:hypothetical protein n=1 Tax=Lacticaseibacillus paracasei TaxID=1597 RepID=UPI0007BF586D|nr:hypothetical protein [Lacticaseibacillus paracasei]
MNKLLHATTKAATNINQSFKTGRYTVLYESRNSILMYVTTAQATQRKLLSYNTQNAYSISYRVLNAYEAHAVNTVLAAAGGGSIDRATSGYFTYHA